MEWIVLNGPDLAYNKEKSGRNLGLFCEGFTFFPSHRKNIVLETDEEAAPSGGPKSSMPASGTNICSTRQMCGGSELHPPSLELNNSEDLMTLSNTECQGVCPALRPSINAREESW